MLDVNTGEENLFYDLTYPRGKLYYYSIMKDRLENEGSLLRKLTDQVKSKLEDEMKVSFGIYSNEYDSDYGLCVAHATLIQELSLD